MSKYKSGPSHLAPRTQISLAWDAELFIQRALHRNVKYEMRPILKVWGLR